MNFLKRRKKVEIATRKKTPEERGSFFSDRLIKDFSLAHCKCELYFPEPSLTLDEFGALKDVCISGDSVTLKWSKQCTLHICEIPKVPSDFVFAIDDTGQDSEVCLNVKLNKCRSGGFNYLIRERHWHECNIKTGDRWQRFVLQLDENLGQDFEVFETKLGNILQLVQNTANPALYLLIAVQSKEEKRRSFISDHREERVQLNNLPRAISRTSLDHDNLSTTSSRRTSSQRTSSQTSITSQEANFASSSDLSDESEEQRVTLSAPFEPAPYYPGGFSEQDEQRLQSSVDLLKDNQALKSFLCDSLHIHPEELPQTFESILKSAILTVSADTLRGPFRQKYEPAVGGVIKRDSAQDSNGDKENKDEQLISAEEDYLPMGAATKTNTEPQIPENKTLTESNNMAATTTKDPRLTKVQETAELLRTAITNNDAVNAQKFAKLLAEEHVEVKIDVKLKPNPQDDKNKEFSLKVNVEDKEASGVSIVLKVKASNTIRDLKNMMLIKHRFPVQVQYWIIGRRIPLDNDTLARCKVRENGYTAFLYLVTAKSAGVDKEDFMRKQARLNDPNFGVAAPTPDPIPQLKSPPGLKPAATGAATALGSGAAPIGGAGATGKGGNKNKNITAGVPIAPCNFLTDDEDKVAKVEPKLARFDVNQLVGSGRGAVGGVGARQLPVNIVAEDFARVTVGARQPVEDEEPQHQGWTCPACTYINQPTRPGCELCASSRPSDYMIPADYVMTDEEKTRLEREQYIEMQTREAQEREQQENYHVLQEADQLNVIPNTDEFVCPICFEDIDPGDGVVLRECLHAFCKECLSEAVRLNEEPELRCPYTDADYSCNGVVQDREVKGLVTKEVYARYLGRSLSVAESQAANSFHCKTADCPGWCIYEDFVNFFVCQVCGKENCLTCKAIHQGMNCKQYQDDLRARAVNDKAASQTQIMIKKMLDDGDAMNCPKCQVIVMKKEGCDWIQCSICKTEICWVTKGPRWGPLGNGDISGGCRCRVNGKMCHPNCNNCH